MPSTWPSYLELLDSGELSRRARQAVEALADCTRVRAGAMPTGAARKVPSRTAAAGGWPW